MKNPCENKNQISVIVDTREQLPYNFKKEKHIQIVREKLATGDYSLKGHTDRIIIERKTLTDLLGVIGNGRDRFKRELQHLKDNCEFPVLLIEGSVSDIFDKYALPFESKIHQNSVIGSLISWSVKFGVQIIFAGNRAKGELITAKYLTKMNEIISDKKTAKKNKKSRAKDVVKC